MFRKKCILRTQLRFCQKVILPIRTYSDTLKQAIPKTHIQPRAPCSPPFSLAAQRVSWDWGTADPRWAPSEQWNAWRENPICESKQWATATARDKGLWAESPDPPQHSRAQQVTLAGAPPSAIGTQDNKNTINSDRYSPNSKVLNSSDNLLIVSSCGWILLPHSVKAFNYDCTRNLLLAKPSTTFVPSAHLCSTSEGRDTSKCYMSYCDLALVGKPFVCLLVYLFISVFVCVLVLLVAS